MGRKRYVSARPLVVSAGLTLLAALVSPGADATSATAGDASVLPPLPTLAQVRTWVPRLPTEPANTVVRALDLAWTSPAAPGWPGSDADAVHLELRVVTANGPQARDLADRTESAGLILRVGTRDCPTDPACSPLESASENDVIGTSTKGLTLRRSGTTWRLTGRVARSQIGSWALENYPAVAHGFPVDLTVTLPAGALDPPTDALHSGATLLRDDRGTTLEWHGSAETPLTAAQVTGTVGPFGVGGATGTYRTWWSDVRTRSGHGPTLPLEAVPAAVAELSAGPWILRGRYPLSLLGSVWSAGGELAGINHDGFMDLDVRGQGNARGVVGDASRTTLRMISGGCRGWDCEPVPYYSWGGAGSREAETSFFAGTVSARFTVPSPAGSVAVEVDSSDGDMSYPEEKPTVLVTAVEVSSPSPGVLAYEVGHRLRFHPSAGILVIGGLSFGKSASVPLSLAGPTAHYEAPAR